MKKVFVICKRGEYWQDGPMSYPCWSWLSDQYTKFWKTRRGAEKFLEKNPGIAKDATIEEVGENQPRSAWR